ncbi:MAG TPA: zinc ribbon domain-containing protein [Terriglobales bacterium]|nr:zinc ribbon domain-containing protein [Terriglobales bacterium]
MEHLCHQCGAAVEDGTAFCKHCGAPQIRIAGEEPSTEPLPPGTPDDVQPPAEPVPLGAVAPTGPQSLDWSQAVPSAAAAGLFLAVSAVIPTLGFLFWLVAGGTLGVLIYRRRASHPALTAGLGARIGAVTGLFGFVIFAVIVGLELLATRGSGHFRELLQQVVQQAAARNGDPRAQQAIQTLMTPAGLALLFTVVLVFLLVAFLALSSIGGALGAWLLGKGSGDAER